MSLCNNCGESPLQNLELRYITRSNSFPPETSSFRSFIAEAPSQLAQYDEEIQRLQEALDTLRSERAVIESFSDECRSVFSPVRCLPTELLVDIFDKCAPRSAHHLSDTTPPEEEIERLAKSYLLQLSQVCSRWHSVVMGTPMLWSTLVVDTVCWDECPVSSDTLLGLVALSLERGVDFPLTLSVGIQEGDSKERPLSELISRHASRWKDIYLCIPQESLAFLAGAQGNLRLLERLKLPSGIFEIAPRLVDVSLFGWSAGLPTLPWGQLRKVAFDNSDSDELAVGFVILPLLSNDVRYNLTVNISSVILPLVLNPVTSDISALSIVLHASSNRTHTDSVVETLLGCLTLPRLHKFWVLRPSDGPPLLWNQTYFLSFASRSSLCDCLTALQIDAVIQEDELVQCLELLISLEELIIPECDDYEDGHVVITDKLLRRLVWRPNDGMDLVPRLRSLCLISLMHFSDDRLWELIDSRGTEDKPLEMYVFSLPRRQRELSVEFLARFLDSARFSELKEEWDVKPHAILKVGAWVE
ncbi:hypothetical protein FB451DRAFT_1207956 [Mycena latifolia]|nr:hypothetical protein FB451DRAFT_1207956 [Mycena latifolia]